MCLHLPYPTILIPQRPARCVLLSPSHKEKMTQRQRAAVRTTQSESGGACSNPAWRSSLGGTVPCGAHTRRPRVCVFTMIPGAERWEPAGGPAAGTRWGWNWTPAGGPRQGWSRAPDAKVSEVTSTSSGRSQREGGRPGCTARPNGRPEAVFRDTVWKSYPERQESDDLEDQASGSLSWRARKAPGEGRGRGGAGRRHARPCPRVTS